MTITERNQKLFELREELNKARAKVAWIEQEIWVTRSQYALDNNVSLFDEMFGG